MDLSRSIIHSLADQHGTPLYLFESGKVIGKCAALRKLSKQGVEILYSIKANPHPDICRLIHEQGLSAELASVGELRSAVNAGFDLVNCMVAGPGKKPADLEVYIDAGVGFINCESLVEAERIASMGIKRGRDVKVNLRINPRHIGSGARLKMGGRPSQFGIDEEEMDSALRKIDGLDGISLTGIHVYCGTQFTDVGKIIAGFEYISELAVRYTELLGRPPEVINFGGGFGISNAGEDGAMDVDALLAAMEVFFSNCRSMKMFSQTRFFIESGRFVVGDAGYFIGTVVDIKVSRGKKFVVLDGGINHYLTASPQFRFDGANPPVHLIRRRAEDPGPDEEREYVDIVGPLCTPMDCLARKISIPSPSVDDLLVFPNAGAYSMTMSPTGFLSHPLPAQIII